MQSGSARSVPSKSIEEAKSTKKGSAMYNIEELNAKTRDELRAIAKEMDIVGRSKMTKSELVNAVYDNKPFEEVAEANEVAEAVVEAVNDEKQVNKVDEKQKSDEPNEVDKLRHENHMKIVEACEVGDFVAFTCFGSKARSAKVTRKSSKRKKFEVETAYGKKFIIDYDMVIWVKKSQDAKWPHGVYKALKGIE